MKSSRLCPILTPLTQGKSVTRRWNRSPLGLPDVEKFSREIGKQSAYIDHLKAQIGQEADYAERMRNEKYAEELKVQKANQKIFELQRTNSQMERLMKKIPPEVLAEIQKSGRNKSRER